MTAFVLFKSVTEYHASSADSPFLIVSEPEVLLVTTTYQLAHQALRRCRYELTKLDNNYAMCMWTYRNEAVSIPCKVEVCDITVVPLGRGCRKQVVHLSIQETPLQSESPSPETQSPANQSPCLSDDDDDDDQICLMYRDFDSLNGSDMVLKPRRNSEPWKEKRTENPKDRWHDFPVDEQGRPELPEGFTSWLCGDRMRGL